MTQRSSFENLKNFVFAFEMDNKDIVNNKELRGEFKDMNDIDEGGREELMIEEDL
jgi:hypothetical protein